MQTIDMTHIYSSKTYKGNWVAIIDHETKPKVVAYAKTLKEAMEKAAQKGYELPLMMPVPKKVLPFIGGYHVIK